MALIRKSTSELSIKPKMSLPLQLALVAVGAIVFCGSLYWSYQAGKQAGHQQIDQDLATISRLNTNIAGLSGQLEKAKEDLIVAQRHQQIQEEAYNRINEAYAGSERKNSYLGSRLDFYRSIISPEDGNAGPAIQSLQAERTEQGVKFDVTLVQAIRHKVQVRGALEVTLIENERSVAVWPSSNPRNVSYQYFEQISGQFEVANISDDAILRVTLTLQDGKQLVRDYPLSATLKTE